MNIFEGSRRIALGIGGLAVIGTMIGLGVNDSYAPISYSISHPNSSFKRMTESCPSEAASHFFTTKTPSGKDVDIALCLLAMSFGSDERRLIPYKVDEKNMVWGEARFSSEVRDYEKTLEKRFAIPTQDVEAVEKEIASSFWRQWREGSGYLAIGLLVYACLVWGIGWIVRGFMGIPMGMDKKPKVEA